MFRLSGLGVRNLRCLKDTGIVDLKPITILVGKNSAGKSTFARLFPLLKQSAERRKQAPVLWFGRLVDFGSFGEAVSSFSRTKEIELLFRFSCSAAVNLSRRRPQIVESEPEGSQSQIDICLKLGADDDESRTVLRQLSIALFGTQVTIDFSGTNFTVATDGVSVPIPENSFTSWTQGTILPHLRVFTKDPSPAPGTETAFYTASSLDQFGNDELRGAVSEFLHGNTATDRKDDIADRLPLASIDALYERCLQLSTAPERWRSDIRALESPNDARFKRLHRALICARLDALLSELDDELERVAGGIGYLEPLRATAQRYYRREEVSIDEIDPKGLNITFFVQGLSSRDKDSLNTWLSSALGFTLSVKSSGGHASLHIQTPGIATSRNMADVGLGYSQIAPVAIQLWAAMRRTSVVANRPRHLLRRQRQARSLVVVEQPELHLHPAYQAKLADVFSACIRHGAAADEKLKSIELVAETHSPNLINRLGELIATGAMAANDVQVLLFESESDNPSVSNVHTATFSTDGVLQNWPLGFFDY